MKLRILSLFIILLLTGDNIFSQWIQTDGPYGSVNSTAFFSCDSLKFVATKCGLFSSRDINTRWNLEKVIDIRVFAKLGDSMLIADINSNLSLIDLSFPGFNSEPIDFISLTINTAANSDSCLYLGTDYGGFYKSAGFQDKWEWLNTGLPVDSGLIPPKFGGGKYYHRFVYSIETNNQYIFAGTQRGIYRADPETMIWESINMDLPLSAVPLIKNVNNIIYICIDKTIYKSSDNGESWEAIYASGSIITSINDIEGALYLTTKGNGIILSQDNGKNWNPLNNSLDDLNVNFIGLADSILVCGTSSGGFYYYDQGIWNPNNEGIICSNIRSIVRAENSLIVNDYNEVYISDNGNDWERITPSVNRELFGGMAVMGDTVFLSVEYDTTSWPYDQPYIIYTPDKGKSWNHLNNPVPFARDDPYGIYCYENRLYAFEDEIMYFTDNLGSTWTEMSLPSEFCNYFYDFLIFDSKPFGIACGNGELVKLDDNGEWILSNSGLPLDRELSGLAYCEGALFTYVDYLGFYVSRDNGNSWTATADNINPGNYISSFDPYGESLFITSQNGILYTDNFGQEWHYLNSGLPNRNLTSIVILNDTIYLGSTGNGVWKCAINQIPLSVNEMNPLKQQAFIYPNPANDCIRISVGEGINHLTVMIFDLAGRKLLSEELDSTELNVSRLESGTYIILIKAEGIKLSEKFIIMR
jgi:hypothetical protein